MPSIPNLFSHWFLNLTTMVYFQLPELSGCFKTFTFKIFYCFSAEFFCLHCSLFFFQLHFLCKCVFVPGRDLWSVSLTYSVFIIYAFKENQTTHVISELKKCKHYKNTRKWKEELFRKITVLLGSAAIYFLNGTKVMKVRAGHVRLASRSLKVFWVPGVCQGEEIRERKGSYLPAHLRMTALQVFPVPPQPWVLSEGCKPHFSIIWWHCSPKSPSTPHQG